ncbi:MAG: precorrin-6y C5,15-methyltransferase (decarboxylating) subunit CbiE [Alphaproteobacteria bacterium]|jgi:precorrin-6Y C5,15-methyltransferase (decarboxylating)
MTAWLNVVGLGAEGPQGLAPAVRTLIDNAEVLVGGRRHLDLAGNDRAEQLTWRLPLDTVMADIAARRGRRVVVLATGDPMAYGIGTTLARHFSRDEMTVLPAPGAFSLAAARLGWPLDEAICLTLHGRPLDLLNYHLLPGTRLLALSHDGTTPAAVARRLVECGFGNSRLTVLENMGATDEARIDTEAGAFGARKTADLNTLAIECVAGPGTPVRPHVAGLPDDAFHHDGKMTKRIVRAATIAALAPQPQKTLWDLGAGSGSVAVEWLRATQNAQGKGATAIAVERDAGRIAMIARNAAALGTPFLDIREGDIAVALPDLPDPDAVFIGGGLSIPGLVDTVYRRLRTGGTLVANAVTLEGEGVLATAYAAHGGTLDRIAISHAEPVGKLTGWRPAMTVTQWTCRKA